MKLRWTLLLALPLLLAPAGRAKIESLDLGQMMARCDDVVSGTVVAKRAFRVDDPVDGPGMYFTTITLEGRSLIDGRARRVDVTWHGGWVSEDEGAWNSVAPAEQDTEVGRQLVVFYKWSEDLGGGVASNVPYAAVGGVYRLLDGPAGGVVLGRGDGFAVPRNTRLDALANEARALRAERIEVAR